MEQRSRVAADRERFEFNDTTQHWLTAWHPPAPAPPSGIPNGSSAICVAQTGELVLVSEDGITWGLPGGRPEGDEDWRQTLEREVLEEACATVVDATLLGFSWGKCFRGPEAGRTLVRAFWRAEVTVDAWAPEFEMRHRLLLPPERALAVLIGGPHTPPIYRRMFYEPLRPHPSAHVAPPPS